MCSRQRQSTNCKREQDKKDFHEGSSELADYFIEEKKILNVTTKKQCKQKIYEVYSLSKYYQLSENEQ
jgi:hypothetical protein